MRSSTRFFAALAAGALVWGSANAAQATPGEAGSVTAPPAVAPATAPAAAPAVAPATTRSLAGASASSDAAVLRQAPNSAGFAVVRPLAAEPVALYAPQAGELWLVERGGEDEIVLEHWRGGRWTTTRLPGQLPYDGTRQVIDGSGPNDIWLAAGEKVYRYDGRRWKSVPPPPLPAGATWEARVVADLPVAGAYVATFGHGVFRYDGRRWAALGSPTPPASDQPTRPGRPVASYWPRFMEVRDGRPYVLFERFDGRAFLELHRYDRSWTKLADGLGSRGPHVSEEPRAWLLERGPKVTVLGYLNAPPGIVGGTCFTWKPGGPTSSCLTATSVSAGAKRADGTLILGGHVSVGGTAMEPRPVPGRFAIRGLSGAESVIPGDPGDEAIALAVEPRSGVTWAATRTGETYVLQRWSGTAARR